VFVGVFCCGVWSYTGVTVSHPNLLFFWLLERKRQRETELLLWWRWWGGGPVEEGEEKTRGSVDEKRSF